MSQTPSRSAAPSVDRRLLGSVRAARVPFALAIVLGVITAVLVVAQASLLGRVIAGAFPGGDTLAEVAPLLWVLAGVIVLRALCAGGFEASGRIGAGRVMSELRARITAHLLGARPAGLREQRSGELVATTVHGVDALEAYFARYLPQLVLAVLVPIVILAWICPRDYGAGGILLVTIPVIIAVPKPDAPEFVPPSVDVMNPLTLVCGPADITVTVAVIVQLPLIGIVPPLKLNISGAVRVKVPPHWVELPEVTVTPAGSVSLKATLFNSVKMLGLVNVKVRVEVPFTATVAGKKLFASVGWLGGRHPVNLTLSINKSALGLELPAL